MIKEKMITRTVLVTEVTARIYDNETGNISDVVVSILGKIRNVSDLERKVENVLTGKKLLSVLSYNSYNKIVGMTESEFLAHGVEMETRTKVATAEEN